MERDEWLLVAIGEETIEPVQVQKLMFMFAQETGVPDDEAYKFVPYNWGPCSFDIYSDIDTLVECGMVQRVSTGRGWSCYGLTGEGKARSEQLRTSADKDHLNGLDEWREWAITQPFRSLLREVYEKYPQYAVASVFED